jgi:malonyl-CoA/methylmalonyl-CoA synthetase
MQNHFLQHLRSQFAQRAGQTALLHRDRSYTYGELEAQACSWAGWLQAQGVEPGDRVALSTPDKIAFLVAHLGTLFAGGVSLPLNPGFTRDEMRYFLADSDARVAVVGTANRARVEELRPELPALQAVVVDTAVAEVSGPFREPTPGAEDACLMIYSSGTTGWPKGVVHTHANLDAGLRALQACWRLTTDDGVVNVLPLFHIHGLCFATHLAWLAGGRVLLDDHFHPQRTLELVGRGSVFMAVPTMYYRFLEQPDFRSAAKLWANVRLFTCGSAPLRPDVLPELESILGRPVINRYGMSEALVITSLPIDGPWPQGSVGLPLEGIEVRVECDKQGPAAPGEVGSVQLRGPNLFRTYWGRPEATQAAFASGWFDTGDLGYRDAAGFLTLVGRKHDLIITNGYNVYPQVVERVVNTCPGVQESAVVGVPDARRGERVVIVVVRADPTLDEKKLRSHWEERLVDYQRPQGVLFLDALPRNAMGKVLRRELRDRIMGAPGASAPGGSSGS